MYLTQFVIRPLQFLLTPLREGRRSSVLFYLFRDFDFYSRPCVRGDELFLHRIEDLENISTHAPA